MTVAGRLRCFGSVILFSFLLAVLGGCGTSSGTKLCSGTCTAPTEFVYATELNDISSFSLSAVGIPTLLGNQSGPNSSQGILVDPSEKYLYVSDFANSNVDAFAINASGGLTGIVESPFSAGSPTGGIAVDPATKFLYVTLVTPRRWRDSPSTPTVHLPRSPTLRSPLGIHRSRQLWILRARSSMSAT